MSSKHQPNPHTVETLRKFHFSARTEESRFQVFSKSWENKYQNPRSDCLGIFDVLAMRPDQGIIGIQCTDAQGTYKHRAKMLESQYLKPWLLAGGRGQIWQWQKVLKGTRMVYRPCILEARIVTGEVTFMELDRDEWFMKLGEFNPQSNEGKA